LYAGQTRQRALSRVCGDARTERPSRPSSRQGACDTHRAGLGFTYGSWVGSSKHAGLLWPPNGQTSALAPGASSLLTHVKTQLRANQEDFRLATPQAPAPVTERQFPLYRRGGGTSPRPQRPFLLWQVQKLLSSLIPFVVLSPVRCAPKATKLEALASARGDSALWAQIRWTDDVQSSGRHTHTGTQRGNVFTIDIVS